MNTNLKICLKSDYLGGVHESQIGQGLTYLPLLSPELDGVELTEWLMSPAEQMGIIYLLEKLRPEIAIEIGTRFGGSLQVLARLSKKVYSLDIDPEVPKRLEGKHANVEYIIGSSLDTVPALMEKLQKEGGKISFVLIDGDHSAEGVRADIENVLKLRPIVPTVIVLHDTYNPECRKGMTSANWSANRYVHTVELDFVSGTIFPRGDLWGGLGLAVLLPEERKGKLEVTARGHRTVKALLPLHNRLLFKDRIYQSIAYRLKKLGFTSAGNALAAR